MGLFDFIRKGSSCKCRKSEMTQEHGGFVNPDKIQSVKVLGTGCKLCHEQLKNVQTTVEKLGLSLKVEYSTDIQEIARYGIMSMPAIVINDKVAAAGRLLKPDEVKSIITEA